MTSPKLAKTTRTGRTYQHPVTGAEYPSVTTVLGIVGKGEALKHWAANEVAKYAVNNRNTWAQLDDAAAIDLLKREPLRFLDRAASRGTDVHALAEAYAKTGTMPQWAEEISGYVEALRRFYDEHQPVPLLVEHTVFNTKVGYAGSFDLLCTLPAFGESVVILDYKTSKAVYPDVAAQLAAYAHATEYVDGNEMKLLPPVERGVVVRFAADGQYQVVECDISAGWEYFKAVRAVFNIPTKPLLLGDVRTPLTHSDTNRIRLRETLVARLAWMRDNNREALQHVVANWSVDLATFKSDHKHSNIELQRIEKIIVDAEREHSVPFHGAVTATEPDQPEPAVQPPVTTNSDELTVDPKEVDKVRKRLESSTDEVRDSVRKIAQQANRAKRNISLNGKPSLRRVLLADTLIDMITESAGTVDLLEATLTHIGVRTDHTLGYDVGGLDIDSIQKMSVILEAIRANTTALQYNTTTNTFSLVKAEKASKK